jgi:hypothetical protein
MGPTAALHLNATGTHFGGLSGGCCGCNFTLVSVVPATATITLVDDDDCKAHLQTTATPEGDYTVTVRVADLCASQSDDLTFDIHVAQTCDCGLKGDVNHDLGTTPLDVQFLVKYVYKSQDALYLYPSCPWGKGDVNCDGGTTPLDVQFLVKYVYKSQDALCVQCP